MSPQTPATDSASQTAITLTIDGRAVPAHLVDSTATRGLIAQLPLTLTFSDYASQEKLAALPQALSMEGMPPGYSPAAGDITWYAPDGVVVLSYTDVGYFRGIAHLGRLDDVADTALLTAHNDDFAVVIELAG